MGSNRNQYPKEFKVEAVKSLHNSDKRAIYHASKFGHALVVDSGYTA